MPSHFNNWVWVKACEAWARATSFVGFADIKTAFLQGYYMGYNKALEETKEEEADRIASEEEGELEEAADGPNQALKDLIKETIENKIVCVWPDGSWCDPEELDHYIRCGSSDDVEYKTVPLDWEG